VTLIDHLAELRTRLFIAIGSWVLAAGVMFGWRFELLDWLKQPLPSSLTLHTFNVMEPIGVSFSISAFFGVVVAAPVIGWQIWAFVAPGLMPSERRWSVPFILLTALAFVAGVAFARFVALPFSLPILVGFLGDEATMLLSTASYISTLLMFMGVFGLIFEMPVLAFLLGKLGVVHWQTLARFRRHSIVAATILAAGITPTVDPLNMALVAIPLIILYEISIWVMRAAQRTPAAATAEIEPQ